MCVPFVFSSLAYIFPVNWDVRFPIRDNGKGSCVHKTVCILEINEKYMMYAYVKLNTMNAENIASWATEG